MTRKPYWRDFNRCKQVRRLVGCEELLALGQARHQINHWEAEQQQRPSRPFMDRVFAVLLFIPHIDLAVSIAQRTTGIREAGREAKAVAALKEIAGG